MGTEVDSEAILKKPLVGAATRRAGEAVDEEGALLRGMTEQLVHELTEDGNGVDWDAALRQEPESRRQHRGGRVEGVREGHAAVAREGSGGC